MKVDGVRLECDYCGEQLQVPAKGSARAFMIVFKRFRRQHDDTCGPKYRVEEMKNNAITEVDKILGRLAKS